jgi:hypothetical protein
VSGIGGSVGQMNKNLMVILFFCLVALGLLVLGAITLFAPTQLDKSVGYVVQILTIASGAIVTIYLLGSQGKTLEEVKANTNGTLSSLQAQLAAKDEQLATAQHQLLTVVGSAPPAKDANL